MSSIPRLAPLGAVLIAGASMLVACGSDGDPQLVLSPEGEVGREIALEKGCASCHGANGQGGVGPAFVGLLGSTVELDGGGSVVADEAFLAESISDPAAKRHDGYSLPMPENNLTDAEIASVIDYIRDLSQPATTTVP